jgi:hypothetical protein
MPKYISYTDWQKLNYAQKQEFTLRFYLGDRNFNLLEDIVNKRNVKTINPKTTAAYQSF